MSLNPGRAKLLSILEHKRSAYAALDYAVKYVSKAQAKTAAAPLKSATPEQLAHNGVRY